MNPCSICALSFESNRDAMRHGRSNHRTAYFANYGIGHRDYVAPPQGFVFCDVCSIFIGPCASHTMSSGHIARVASAAVASSAAEAQSGDSSRREPTVRPAVPTLEIFGDLPVFSSGRARKAAPERAASPPAENDGLGEWEDDGPGWDEAAPSQVLSSSIFYC
jgi:hypothetical protein